MINSVIDPKNGITAKDYKIIEWMLREKLPKFTGTNTVRAWVCDEFSVLKPEAPAWFTKGLY